MSTRVYSPTGEPFDIPRRDTADNLILEKGWTQTAPVQTESREEKPKAKSTKRKTRRAKQRPEELYHDSDDEDSVESDLS